jgi:hypothetical protein
MPYDVGFAKRRFPDRCQAIDELAARNEDFRDLCLDFETADTVMRKWEASDAVEREARYAEFSLLVDELAKEITATLDAAAVIPFGKPQPRGR